MAVLGQNPTQGLSYSNDYQIYDALGNPLSNNFSKNPFEQNTENTLTTQFGIPLVNPDAPEPAYGGNTPGNGSSQFGNLWGNLTSPIGSGNNATTGLQLGLGVVNSLTNLRNFNKSFRLAKDQLNFQKDYAGTNFVTNGTNWMNQNLAQVQGLNDFNAGAGAERAANVQAGLNQLNEAGAKLGLGNNVFGSQSEALKKYNSLV